MSKEDLAALAATAEERQTANLRKWLAMPEVREFLNESARQMRETVRAEMRAERESRQRRISPPMSDVFMAFYGPVELSGSEWEQAKAEAMRGLPGPEQNERISAAAETIARKIAPEMFAQVS